MDHGTAYDIAGKGKADESSMKAAILLAVGTATYEAKDQMNPSIFREYDIRGLAEQDFDKQSALL